MGSQDLVFIPLSHWNVILNYAQVCKYAYIDSSLHCHTTLSVMWSFLSEYRGLSSVLFTSYQNTISGFYSLSWIRTHLWKALDSNHFAINLNVQHLIFFSPCLLVKERQIVRLCVFICTAHMKSIWDCLAWDSKKMPKETLLKIGSY